MGGQDRRGFKRNERRKGGRERSQQISREVPEALRGPGEVHEGGTHRLRLAVFAEVSEKNPYPRRREDSRRRFCQSGPWPPRIFVNRVRSPSGGIHGSSRLLDRRRNLGGVPPLRDQSSAPLD